MNHYNEDILYKFVLDILDSADSDKISSHVNECKICDEKISEINKQIKLLGSYNPEIDLNRIKEKSSQKLKRIIPRAAAIILIGLTIGYYIVNYSTEEKIVVVGQSFIPQHSLLDSLKFVECPNIDISTEY